jgi:DNA-directed RNA polymerase subunit M/transcription elongation factor TFIIS
MEFCEICNNMLYVKCNDEKKLVKFCKHCEFSKVETSTKSIKISETMYTEDDLLYNQHINKYLRYDPTLRRIKDNIIKCPNKECDVEPEKEQILYIKYHPNNMKYLYVCDHCGYIWRTGKE